MSSAVAVYNHGLIYHPWKAYLYRLGPATPTITNSPVLFPFDAALYDPTQSFVPGLSGWVVPVGGFYLVNACTEVNTPSSATRLFTAIMKAGGTIELSRGTDYTFNFGAQGFTVTNSNIVKLNAGELVQLYVGSNASGTTFSLNNTIGPNSSNALNNYLTIHLLSLL
jgi:hypothetical protein